MYEIRAAPAPALAGRAAACRATPTAAGPAAAGAPAPAAGGAAAAARAHPLGKAHPPDRPLSEIKYQNKRL